MINNVSFNGHAKIDTNISDKDQIKLFNALKDPIKVPANKQIGYTANNKDSFYNNNQLITKQLPDDVEIKFSAKDAYKGIGYLKTCVTEYVAEFFKGEEKFGELRSKDNNNLIDFVSNAFGECTLNLAKANEEESYNKPVLEMLKNSDGIVA